MEDPLSKLIENCRLEMGPEVFREFKASLAGDDKPEVKPRLTCALCGGDGINPFDETKVCEGCNGHGEF